MLRWLRQRRHMTCDGGEVTQQVWGLSAPRGRFALAVHAVAPRRGGAAREKIRPLEK